MIACPLSVCSAASARKEVFTESEKKRVLVWQPHDCEFFVGIRCPWLSKGQINTFQSSPPTHFTVKACEAFHVCGDCAPRTSPVWLSGRGDDAPSSAPMLHEIIKHNACPDLAPRLPQKSLSPPPADPATRNTTLQSNALAVQQYYCTLSTLASPTRSSRKLHLRTTIDRDPRPNPPATRPVAQLQRK